MPPLSNSNVVERKLAFQNTVKEGHHRIKNPSNRYNLVPRSQRSSSIPYYLTCRFVNLFFEFPKLENTRCLFTFLTFLFLKSLSTTEQTELPLQTSAGRQKTEMIWPAPRWELNCQQSGDKASLAGSKHWKSEISRQNLTRINF